MLPAFELPPYEGIEVEQEKVDITDADMDEVLARIRRDHAKLVPVDGVGPAVDGQVVNIDFSAFEDGKPVEGLGATSFDLALGERQALEDAKNL